MDYTGGALALVDELSNRMTTMLRESAQGYQDASRARFQDVVENDLRSKMLALHNELEHLNMELHRATALLEPQ
ncbi:hypothetical protein EEB13_10135 [Rhodococcus sp. WS3]|nr:hypothetical protein EEB13_10135 [Rhodococcus sp. WS3]